MKLTHWITLVVLAAISGSSFIFTRSLAPSLGAFVTADLRVLVGGLSLLAYAAFTGFQIEWRRYWKLYAVIGVINSGLPFLLYSFAALYLPASYLAIVNASAPLFGAFFAVIWLGDTLTYPKVAGLMLGMLGVTLVSYAGSEATVSLSGMFGVGIAACIAAAMCYALSGIYIKRFAKEIKPMAIAAGSQVAAGIVMLPFCFIYPAPWSAIDLHMVLNMAALGVLCSAVAYVIYFKLIAEVGPVKTLTVTFISPFFAMTLGALFLGERVNPTMLLGCISILAATALVNGLWRPRVLAVTQS